MAEHYESGRLAEQLATEWLIGKNDDLVASNFRHGHAESDLVMKRKDLLIYVAEKFRSGPG